MINGKIETEEFKVFLEGVFDHEVADLEKQYYGSMSLENDRMGVLDIKLHISNILKGNFVHNDTFLLIGKAPYEELSYHHI